MAAKAFAAVNQGERPMTARVNDPETEQTGHR
jgi:hypothetical protein